MSGSDHMPGPGHKEALEADLLGHFDALYTAQRRKQMQRRSFIGKAAFGVAIAAALGVAACAAPMDVDVAVGKSLSIDYEEGAAMPEPQAVMDALRASGEMKNMGARVRVEQGKVAIRIEAWGEDLDDGEPLADRLKKALPALASAKIVEEPLSGKVKSTLGRKLGHDLFDLDITNEKDVEAIREKILADLAAKGVEGKVEVEVEGDGVHEQKVKVKVIQEDCEPGQPPPALPPLPEKPGQP
jgi:hypothetical protein